MTKANPTPRIAAGRAQQTISNVVRSEWKYLSSTTLVNVTQMTTENMTQITVT